MKEQSRSLARPGLPTRPKARVHSRLASVSESRVLRARQYTFGVWTMSMTGGSEPCPKRSEHHELFTIYLSRFTTNAHLALPVWFAVSNWRDLAPVAGAGHHRRNRPGL